MIKAKYVAVRCTAIIEISEDKCYKINVRDELVKAQNECFRTNKENLEVVLSFSGAMIVKCDHFRSNSV